MFKTSKAFSGFSVDDIDAAKAFYGDTLGLVVTEQEMGLIGLELGSGATVLVYPKPNHQPATFTILNFPVADIDEAVAALTEKGVDFERYEGSDLGVDEQGIAHNAGPRIAWFKDPAGNTLSVIEADGPM